MHHPDAGIQTRLGITGTESTYTGVKTEGE